MRKEQRRRFLAALTVLTTAPLLARAQARAKPAHIGFLTVSSPEFASSILEAFKQGMRDVGHVEGKDYVLDVRSAGNRPEALPALAQAMVSSNVDVIVVFAAAPAQAVQRATTSIPIVVGGVGDPIGFGFAKTLSHPGGNITGIASFAQDLGPKYLQLLVDLLSSSPKQVAVLLNVNYRPSVAALQNIQAAARAREIQILPIELRNVGEIISGMNLIAQKHADALIVLTEPVLFTQRRRIADLARKMKIPTIFQYREGPEDGGLMSYGQNLADTWRHAAVFVDKILNGSKAGELPFEQPTKFELVVNQRTAKELGIKIPESIMFRADKVIQ